MAEEQKTHTHVLEDGTVVEHSHGEHGHHHSHAHTKAVLNRMSRAIGHMESIKRMIEDGRDCAEVLIQLSAVKSAINNTGKIILQDHIEHCIVDAVEHGDKEAIKELEVAIDRFVKYYAYSTLAIENILLLFTHHYPARCFGMNMPKSRDIQAKIPLP